MKNKQLFPELRFPEFSGDWVPSSLGDYYEFKNGVNADKGAYGRGTKFINVLDIISDQPIVYENIIGSVEISLNEFQKNEVKYGDILFQRSSETREEVGQSNIYVDKDNSATFGGFVIRGRPIKGNSPQFFHYLLKTDNVRKDMTSRSGGSTRYNIGQESLSQVSIIVAPTIVEQEKIGEFLTLVDKKVTLLDAKYRALRAYKDESMRQIFSQEVRFSSDVGTPFSEWRPMRIEEIGEIYGGLTGKSGSDFGHGYRYITYKQVFDNSRIDLEKCERVVIAPGENQNRVCRGDIIFTTSSETPEEVGFASVVFDDIEDVYLNSFCFGLRQAHPGVLMEEFARYLFRSHLYRARVYPLAQGSTRYNISKASFVKLELPIPQQEEQEKIAAFLGAIDARMEKTAVMRDGAVEFKKALLQQMFI